MDKEREREREREREEKKEERKLLIYFHPVGQSNA